MNQKFFENLAKPCQTAGRPEQVSPPDETARTAPWRRSPELPCLYSYRQTQGNETNPFSPNSRGTIDFKARPQPLEAVLRSDEAKIFPPSEIAATLQVNRGAVPLALGRMAKKNEEEQSRES